MQPTYSVRDLPKMGSGISIAHNADVLDGAHRHLASNEIVFIPNLQIFRSLSDEGLERVFEKPDTPREEDFEQVEPCNVFDRIAHGSTRFVMRTLKGAVFVEQVQQNLFQVSKENSWTVQLNAAKLIYTVMYGGEIPEPERWLFHNRKYAEMAPLSRWKRALGRKPTTVDDVTCMSLQDFAKAHFDHADAIREYAMEMSNTNNGSRIRTEDGISSPRRSRSDCVCDDGCSGSGRKRSSKGGGKRKGDRKGDRKDSLRVHVLRKRTPLSESGTHVLKRVGQGKYV